ncbi:mce related family protein, partial [Vibrio parahaemolyticus V-223/04]
RNTWKISR